MSTATITAPRTDEFLAPAFPDRVKSMLKLDLYRLIHTPAFYIMLLVAAVIPAMVISTNGTGSTGATTQFTNAWQLIESTGGSAVAANPLDFGGFANINMLFIFAGLLMSLFVAHDYSSGFVKNIFTVHAKKSDYVISKTIIGVLGGTSMILTYLVGTVTAGLFTGKSFDVNVAGLVFCLIAKALMMGVLCSLFLAIAVFFRDKLWLTIVFTFLLGMMLYPAASSATLASTVLTVLGTLVVSVIGATVIGAISTVILNKRDLA